MGLSKTALARRHKYLGASEVPSVLGVSPEGWPTASDVYYRKTAKFEPEDKVTEAMLVGILCEPAVLSYAKSVLGNIKCNQFRVHKSISWQSATLDAICVDLEKTGIEAKTTGNSRLWGEQGTDQIPNYYLAQVQWQMYITGFTTMYVPVLMPDFTLKFKMYKVERDQAVIDSIVARCTEFWEENVLKRVPPKDTLPAPRTLQLMKRVPQKVTTISSLLVQDYKDKCLIAKDAVKDKDNARLKMVESLGDAEYGKYDGGCLEYVERERKERTHTVKAKKYRSLKIKEGEGDDV